ncbi:hypothetical protein M0638_24875 [Roseomonas sp. NAR14]|uniref:EF-hand domain-containing protein n=1 Tax=Roseomonas acroporae TaxID=2937791 RepID=A0A9X2C000_9PROT|nr:hypothetical protein [Roseomonas acroporae]MCK8787605.1 hypothetical protein [Roseomonas acroporae]
MIGTIIAGAAEVRQRLFEHLNRDASHRDTDGDGRVSAAERAAARQNVPGSGANGPSAFETALRQADSDGDGTVTRRELVAAGRELSDTLQAAALRAQEAMGGVMTQQIGAQQIGA